jgi:hypothetical protein
MVFAEKQNQAIMMKSKQTMLGKKCQIRVLMFFLESISILSGFGNKAKVCFRGAEISSMLGGQGWVGGWECGEGL